MLFAVFVCVVLSIILCWLCLVSCTELIKQSLVDDSKLGEAVRPYVERKMLGKHVTNIIKTAMNAKWVPSNSGS